MLLLLGVDHFLDMGRSATNVVGNSVATAVVAEWEGELLAFNGNGEPVPARRARQPSALYHLVAEQPVLFWIGWRRALIGHAPRSRSIAGCREDQLACARRGKLRVDLFGGSAGVGKTCSMLEAAHRVSLNGADLVPVKARRARARRAQRLFPRCALGPVAQGRRGARRTLPVWYRGIGSLATSISTPR